MANGERQNGKDQWITVTLFGVCACSCDQSWAALPTQNLRADGIPSPGKRKTAVMFS